MKIAVLAQAAAAASKLKSACVLAINRHLSFTMARKALHEGDLSESLDRLSKISRRFHLWNISSALQIHVRILAGRASQAEEGSRLFELQRSKQDYEYCAAYHDYLVALINDDLGQLLRQAELFVRTKSSRTARAVLPLLRDPE